MNYLTEDQLAEFDELGYLVFEGLFDSQLNQRIKDDVDLLMIDRAAGKHKPIISYDELGALTSEPCVVDRVADLMVDQKFAHHHIHARWQTEGEPGIVWHHDYEQIPQTNRSHLMVHVFMYMDGLNGEIGDLLVLPGSHRMVIDRRAPQLFKYAALPESLTIDSLAPGSAIILHSAIVHARRPKPGGANFR
ncbi:MAG: phytanoyl-CoA dioxygenase family protein, partial [Gammaproteobacteria bacterium]|nr:phytanoyl-CoA dioxygenase family protein [Gammaproteobacteria bacterium]